MMTKFSQKDSSAEGRKRKWFVTFSENGWEYTGGMTIRAESVTQIATTKLLADGVEIDLDEEIGTIQRD